MSQGNPLVRDLRRRRPAPSRRFIARNGGPTDRLLNPVVFSRYNNFPFGVPSGRRVSQLSFSLQNSVEMKVRDSQDTTGTTPFKKVSLIDGLDFNVWATTSRPTR